MLFVIKHINKFWTRGQGRITLKFSTKKNRKFQDTRFLIFHFGKYKKKIKVLVFWPYILKKTAKFKIFKVLTFLLYILKGFKNFFVLVLYFFLYFKEFKKLSYNWKVYLLSETFSNFSTQLSNDVTNFIKVILFDILLFVFLYCHSFYF